jgi:hypothetical protein
MLWSGDIEASIEDVQNPLSQLLQISGHLGARAGFAPRGRRAFMIEVLIGDRTGPPGNVYVKVIWISCRAETLSKRG